MKKTNRVLWSLGAGLILGLTGAFLQIAQAEEGAAPATDSSAAPANSAPADNATPAATEPAAAPAAEPASAEATAPTVADSVPEMESAPEPQGGFFSRTFPSFDITGGGFLRAENAWSTSSTDNPANQLTNIYNGKPQPRQAFVPPGYLPQTCAGVVSMAGLGTLAATLCGPTAIAVNNWTTLAFPTVLAGDAATPGLRGTFSANPPATLGGTSQLSGTPFPLIDNKTNYQVLRGEYETGIKFTPDLSMTARIRAIYDNTPYHDFNAHSVTNTIATGGGGIRGGDPALYHGQPSYYQYRVEGDTKPNPLEWTGQNYMVYFPTLVMDYTRGALNLRFGNQQIAWGQSLFFRVFDVVDGLDLRRHLILDYAQEEYADERVPALGLRASYQFSDAWLADAFIQKFQPSVLPNPNTQYNVIPVGFTVHDLYHTGGYDNKNNFGIRFKGNYGQWGFQAMATHRYNPDGVYRWTKSGVDRNLPCSNITNSTIACRVELTLTGEGKRSGALLANSAFEVAPGGVYSANEWFNYAGKVRLSAVDGLNASINEFPSTAELFATPVTNKEQAYNELNTFFIAAGGSLRGHIAREYFQEDVYALGASYVTEGKPGGILDQLIINLEQSYTPNRTFTNTTLSHHYPRTDSNVTSLVLEKYYRFSDAFPATYFVFQFMHRDKDDLFGRLLSGYGGTTQHQATGVSGGANYVVLAFQQPFPQDVYRVGFATLYDPRGSLLIQPGLTWKPRSAFQVDGFYTYINGSLGNANPNDTLLSTIDFADEFTLRLSYQF